MTKPVELVEIKVGDRVCLIYGVEVEITRILKGDGESSDDLIVAEVVNDDDE